MCCFKLVVIYNSSNCNTPEFTVMPFTETESTGEGAEAGALLGHTGFEVSMIYPSGDTR